MVSADIVTAPFGVNELGGLAMPSGKNKWASQRAVESATRRGVRPVAVSVPQAPPFRAVSEMARSGRTPARKARAAAVNQGMAIRIGAGRKQTAAGGAGRIGARPIGTPHPVPRQRSCTPGRIEPTLRLHDDAPA